MDANTKFLTLTSILILIVVGLLSGGTFLNPYNIQSMGFQLAELGLLSLAMMSGNSRQYRQPLQCQCWARCSKANRH
jgi:Kef-type K+ transport system membrane component KefB